MVIMDARHIIFFIAGRRCRQVNKFSSLVSHNLEPPPEVTEGCACKAVYYVLCASKSDKGPTGKKRKKHSADSGTTYLNNIRNYVFYCCASFR